ncbi:MAG: beta-ketoacyl-ACP synthase II [Chloroflexi bacterium]|nr:beta-ketoacyl-ACP synthase II [Chloroflexota bacterium]
MAERIVITGLGAVSPLGLSAQESWEGAVNGVSGVAPITHIDTTDYLVHIACEVKNFDPKKYMHGRDARRSDRYEQFAIAAAQEAMTHSGLQVTDANADRIGVIVSSSVGGLGAFGEAAITVLQNGPRKISPFIIPKMMSNGGAGMIGIAHNLKGPSFSVASACASGADGIGVAWMMMRAGLMDACVVGAAEATITETGLAAFDRIGAMSRRNNDPLTPQPFDKNRDGLVMGEGAGILIMERENHAKARGAEILAELAGHAGTADAFHVTAPSEGGVGGAQAIRLALKYAGVNPDDVSYISAHGTATPLNDAAETRAIKAAFGDIAYNIPVSSTKSMTGHMMGATGALEAVFCVQAIRDNVVPPTINYQTPDPECDLDYVPNQAREIPVRVTLSNAFGFGGHNAVLVIREYLG